MMIFGLAHPLIHTSVHLYAMWGSMSACEFQFILTFHSTESMIFTIINNKIKLLCLFPPPYSSAVGFNFCFWTLSCTRVLIKDGTERSKTCLSFLQKIIYRVKLPNLTLDVIPLPPSLPTQLSL